MRSAPAVSLALLAGAGCARAQGDLPDPGRGPAYYLLQAAISLALVVGDRHDLELGEQHRLELGNCDVIELAHWDSEHQPHRVARVIDDRHDDWHCVKHSDQDSVELAD